MQDLYRTFPAFSWKHVELKQPHVKKPHVGTQDSYWILSGSNLHRLSSKRKNPRLLPGQEVAAPTKVPRLSAKLPPSRGRMHRDGGCKVVEMVINHGEIVD